MDIMDNETKSTPFSGEERVIELENRIAHLEKQLIRFGILDTPNGTEEKKKEDKNKARRAGIIIAGVVAVLSIPIALLFGIKRKKG